MRTFSFVVFYVHFFQHHHRPKIRWHKSSGSHTHIHLFSIVLVRQITNRNFFPTITATKTMRILGIIMYLLLLSFSFQYSTVLFWSGFHKYTHSPCVLQRTIVVNLYLRFLFLSEWILHHDISLYILCDSIQSNHFIIFFSILISIFFPLFLYLHKDNI